jgi:hypothetical protein
LPESVGWSASVSAITQLPRVLVNGSGLCGNGGSAMFHQLRYIFYGVVLMSWDYKWWLDKQRMPRIVNKAGMAQLMGVSLKTIDNWIRKGAPVLEPGSNGVSYKIDATAFLEWIRAYWRGITIAELRRQDIQFNRWLTRKYP